MRRRNRATGGGRRAGRSRALRALAAITVLLAPLATTEAARAQSPPPDAPWRTFRTEHFRVTHTPELATLARQAGSVAEATWAVLAEELASPPRGLIDLVVTDHVDYTNGFAQPFHSNRIVVFARPPAAGQGLAYSRDWLELVVAHELVHIFHLDTPGPLGFLRRALGRIPSLWPIFPVALTPTWSIEGLATHYESRLTGGGRVHGSYHDMIIRTAVLEDRLPGLDELSAPNPVWPGGTRSYVYGAALMRYIAEEHGDDAHRRIIDETGESLRPTFLLFDHVAEGAVGREFDALYREWRSRAAEAARDAAERIRAGGVTETTPVAGQGPYARTPRVSPDGGTLSFAAHDYRSDPATRLTDLSSGRVRTLARKNQFGSLFGPAPWLPDGSGVIIAQLERPDPYRAWSDLWRVDRDGRERRITRGARVAQPDVAPDGRRVAAVREDHGSRDLVVVDLETGGVRTLVDAGPGDTFDAPRWSPDGRRIAATRYQAGLTDLVVVDAATGAVHAVTRDAALDSGAAWTPDGRWLLWSSDRTGVPNLFAVPAAELMPPVLRSASTDERPTGIRQVTSVLTGAFDPEVAPDGRTIYLSVYHYDGWRIEAMPLESASWRPAPEPGPMASYRPALLPDPDAWLSGTEPAETPSSRYSPLPTVRPFYWIPFWTTVGAGTSGAPDQGMTFVGALSSGEDVVGRHQWIAEAAVDVNGTGRFAGLASWTYRGLGNPTLSLTAWRDWEGRGTGEIAGAAETVYRRTDALRLSATALRSRWRDVAWLSGSAEIEWRELVAHSYTAGELADLGLAFDEIPTRAGIALSPGYSSARYHPFSISAEDGVSGSLSVGRWWDLDDGRRAYDQLLGRFSGYVGLPLGGFADHVAAVRASGLERRGDGAASASVGGASGSFQAPFLPDLGGTGTFLPVRGFRSGARAGTRAWTLSGEYRFPILLRNAPEPGVFGLSLTSVAGSVFFDAGNAWCPERSQRDRPFSGCPPDTPTPLMSAGAELVLDLGVFHSNPLVARVGAAQPLRGPESDASVYLVFGPAF